MHRRIVRASWLLALLISTASEAQIRSSTSLIAAVGEAGSESFAFGTELWALSQITLLPEHNISIETVEVSDEADRLNLLRDGKSHFALVRDQVPASLAHHARAVIALWPNGIGAAAARPIQLLVHVDVDEDVVYRITRMIFEHVTTLGRTRAAMGIKSPRKTIVALGLSLHPGAYRYYEEQELGFEDPPTSGDRHGEAALLYGALSNLGLNADEALQLAAACREAALHGALNLFDGDQLPEDCSTYGANRMIVELMEASNAEGRDRVAPNRHGKVMRYELKSNLPGQQPTM